MTVVALLWTLFLLPVAGGIACAACRSARAVLVAIRAGVVATALVAGACVWSLDGGGSIATAYDWLRLDALSAYHLAVMLLVFVMSSFYLPGYFHEEAAAGARAPEAGAEEDNGHNVLTARDARRFGLLWFGALAAMTLVLISNNLGIMWVGIEATTLLTAFLICIHRTPGIARGDVEIPASSARSASPSPSWELCWSAASASGLHLPPSDALLWTHLRQDARRI